MKWKILDEKKKQIKIKYIPWDLCFNRKQLRDSNEDKFNKEFTAIHIKSICTK